MKTATIPPIRVEQALRDELQSMLADGETLSGFVESALRASVAARKSHREFVARGLAAISRAEISGNYTPAAQVLDTLKAHVQSARKAKKR